jgi:UrcA family protein
MYMHRIIGGAGAFFALTLATSAFAGEPQAPVDTHQVFVSFRGIDLSQEAGGKALLGRLEVAASKVCRRAGDRTLEDQEDYRRCRKQAVAEAVKQANRPMLTAAHTGGSPITFARNSQRGSGG